MRFSGLSHSNKKAIVLGALFALMFATIGYGLYHRHYFVVFVFGLWFISELLLERFQLPFAKASQSHLKSLFPLFEEWSKTSVLHLDISLSELLKSQALLAEERKEAERFLELVEFKKLHTGMDLRGRRAIRQFFCVRPLEKSEASTLDLTHPLNLQDITEGAILTARLYRRVLDTAMHSNTLLKKQARVLLEAVFQVPFNEVEYVKLIDRVDDTVQRDGGLSFLVLNLLKQDQWKLAKQLGESLLTSHYAVDEDVRSSLYWLIELSWFLKEQTNVPLEYETTIRYLYHICFLKPERAHFLEIDSQFFSQFETVGELAREAFLFKETLVEKFLSLWKEQEGFFDTLFQEVLEAMTSQKSKIYSERTTWERLWNREKDLFCKDYLYVVEGNLSFARGHFEDAKSFYEDALKLNASLRAALLNSVFAYAKLGMDELHEWSIQRIFQQSQLMPSALYVAGNSHLLLGHKRVSEEYFKELSLVPGWERKVHYYRSTFCFEHGLYEEALSFAKLAKEDSPSDTSILYHLSLCYNALGEKDQALNMIKTLESAPRWMDYYRFTLERDAGQSEQASKTLLKIPLEYFEDPEELEAALDFARDQKDFTLLRHLRKS